MEFKTTDWERSQVVVYIELLQIESGPPEIRQHRIHLEGKQTGGQTLVTDDTNTGGSQSQFSGVHDVLSENEES